MKARHLLYGFVCAALVVGTWLLGVDAVAQTGPATPSSARSLPPIHVTISGLHQEWSDPEPTFQQNSASYGIQVAARPNLTLRGNINQVVVEGDNLRSVGGLSDLQLGGLYVINSFGSRLLIDLAISLPTGRTSLPDAAYETASRMALSQYDLVQPYFGQGRVIAPSIGWVRTAGENFAYSFGFSYRWKSDYKPFEGLTEPYNWGNEFIMTAGADWRVKPMIRLFGEASWTSYNADKFGSAEVYDAGDRLSAMFGMNVQLGRHDFGIHSNYRNLAENQRIYLGTLTPEPTTSFPDLFQVSGYGLIRISSAIRAYVDFGVSRYGEALDNSELDVFSTSFKPTISLSPKISLPLYGKYHFGDLKGFEAGAGLSLVI